MKKKSGKGIPMSNMHDLDKLMGGSWGHGEGLKAPQPTHTPTPWVYDKRNGEILGDDAGQYVIRDLRVDADVLAVRQQNDASFIVRAVNSHEALLEIVKELRYIIQNHGDLQLGPQGRHATLERRVLAVIAQADGGK